MKSNIKFYLALPCNWPIVVVVVIVVCCSFYCTIRDTVFMRSADNGVVVVHGAPDYKTMHQPLLPPHSTCMTMPDVCAHRY